MGIDINTHYTDEVLFGLSFAWVKLYQIANKFGIYVDDDNNNNRRRTRIKKQKQNNKNNRIKLNPN